MRPGVEHQHQPIVPGARFIVTCNCGARFDSAAPSGEAAVAEMRVDHDPAHEHLSVEAVDYATHPLHAGRRR